MTASDQTCLVTGATSGIGRAIALSLAAAGMTLGLVGRDASRLDALSSEVRCHSVRVESYRADLSSDEDIRRISSDLRRQLGTLDILIHSAGAFRMGPIMQASVDEFDLLYRVNVRAPYFLTQALLPMLADRRGQVVFINSSAGLTARAGVGPYAATKHALKAIADSLRAEVNDLGVRVITVYPGRTATPQQEKIHEQEGKPYRSERLLQAEDVARAVSDALAMPRTAEVTDIHIRPMLKS
jgi:NADP-dependent 3-hydroxy acid dehydrogenase YdfG